MSWILKPHDDAPRSAFGGKAWALRELCSAGFPVPAWFVVDARLPEVSDPLFEEALGKALAELGAKRVAVRSSASDEDGAEHSFAGQLESYLFVDPSDVAARVRDVRQSGFSERIRAYRQERGLGEPVPPAVLVQAMVDADSAGVAFAVDPVSGAWGRALVSAVHGLGTALVGGEADADTWAVDREGRIQERSVASKTIRHRFDPAALEGVSAEPLPEALREGPVLTDEQILRVAALARECGRHFGRPQDIEWAYGDGQLFLLQSRPITTLGRTADPEAVPALWDNSNIAESYSGITTPLTYTFARRAYEEVYRQFCRLMGVREAVIEAHGDTFRAMIGLVKGRVYYNLLAWYRVLALFPGYQANRGFMEQMMGVKEGLPEELMPRPASVSGGAKLLDALRLLGTVGGLVRAHLTLPRQIRRFYGRLDEALAEPAVPFHLQRPEELAAAYRDLERRMIRRWDAPLVNDFLAMIFFGTLRKLCQTWCRDEEGTLQNDLVGGEGGMVSAEPAARVREMAAEARKDPVLAEKLRSGSCSSIRAALGAHPGLEAMVQAYLQRFGDRCLEELKLESSTLLDDPLPLMRAVGHFAAREGDIPDHAAEARREAERRAFGRVGPFRRPLFRWVLGHARARVRDRENLRFERTRAFGRVRRISLELGRRLHGLGQLEDPRDVFYLELDELLGWPEGTSSSSQLGALARARKADFARFAAEPAPPERFLTRGTVHSGQDYASALARPVADEDPRSRKGLGCCPGLVQGRCRVVRDPRGVELPAGCILVAERTDPGWIMLFPAAAGLLVERGSLLSHSAIVARELGIPAVVSVPGLTDWLKDGDLVELDGRLGTVRRLEENTHAQ
jgi:pyruvate,water dikinase